MLRLLCSAVALSLAACGGSSSPATQFSAQLNGAAEVPATQSAATGTATFTVAGTTVNYKVSFSGLSGAPTGSHIHVGSTTVAGGVVVPFKNLPAGTSGDIQGSFTAADVLAGTGIAAGSLDDLLTQMRAGNTYVNIHSAQSPGGEIRGQIHE